MPKWIKNFNQQSSQEDIMEKGGAVFLKFSELAKELCTENRLEPVQFEGIQQNFSRETQPFELISVIFYFHYELGRLSQRS